MENDLDRNDMTQCSPTLIYLLARVEHVSVTTVVTSVFESKKIRMIDYSWVLSQLPEECHISAFKQSIIAFCVPPNPTFMTVIITFGVP